MTEVPAVTPPPPEIPRRGFVGQGLAVLFGAIVSIVPMVPVVGMLLDPILRKRRAVGPTGSKVEDGYIAVGSRTELTPGEPKLVSVIADQQDYWNTFPNQSIGSVYLTKQQDGSINCFNARCPHLGCTVNFKSGQDIYYCPCHDSAFNPDGTRKNDIPPRDLDELETKIDADGRILVKFENYRVGVHDKTPV